jgi:hypothetical protein
MVINLLPAIEKKERELEKVWRKTLASLVLVLISLIFLIFILTCLNLYISSKVNSFEKIVSEKEKELKTSQFQNFKRLITSTNQNLSKIQNFWKEEISITSLFEKLSGVTPKFIYFTNFTYQKKVQEIEEGEKKKKEKEIFAEIHISGWARNREDLFFFKKNLENQEDFKEVYFSPDSWIKPTDIDFSLTFKFIPFNQSK